MEHNHGEDVEPGSSGVQVAPFERTALTDDEPVIASPFRGVAPHDYHRAISAGWWLAAFGTGALAWIALLG